jgi:Mg-chelatase subunit ChlD
VTATTLIFDLPSSPLRLEFISFPVAAVIFLLLAAPVVWLGLPILKWHGLARGWTSIAVRLSAMWVVVMLLGGARWERQGRDVEVVVARDVSESVDAASHPRGKTILDQTDELVRAAAREKPSGDGIGIVSFDADAMIDSLPGAKAQGGASAVRRAGAGGTDIAQGIQTALASFSGESMRRIVLVSDGNQTRGDLEPALTACRSAGVPVDVLPLHYQIDNEVMIEKVVAPAMRREGEPITLEVILRSTNEEVVHGRISVTDCGRAVKLAREGPHPNPPPEYRGREPSRTSEQLDSGVSGEYGGREVSGASDRLDSGLRPEYRGREWSLASEHLDSGVSQGYRGRELELKGDASSSIASNSRFELARAIALRPRGATSITLRLPPAGSGVHVYSARFEPDERGQDTIAGNNTADALTVVRGRSRVLYVDHEQNNLGLPLQTALQEQGFLIDDPDRIDVDQFPTSASDLQGYDAIVLANVPRAPLAAERSSAGSAGLDIGLSREQERALIRYVKDLGGGLVMIGGPEALGAGQWQGSELEKILPLSMQPAEQKVMPAGALVLVLDRSGSMADPIAPGISKMQVSNESAILALQTLTRRDYVGVVAFDTSPNWVVPLAGNAQPRQTIERIHQITPGGGTSIYPALKQACQDLAALPPGAVEVKHILLMTDGQSDGGDYDRLLVQLRAARITLSTIAVGRDADRGLLARLAHQGGGRMYAVDDPHELTQVFVREARALRRPLIHEPPGGIPVAIDSSGINSMPGVMGTPWPRLRGMVLSSAKRAGPAQVVLRSDEPGHDPILAVGPAGLGQVAIFTGDATTRWGRDWLRTPGFARFWSDVMHKTARAQGNRDFDVRMVRDGDQARLIVEAADARGARSFLWFAGKLVGPDPHAAPADVHLEQTGPGRYEARLRTPMSGPYFAAVEYASPSGEHGMLSCGMLVPGAPELHDLSSNDALLTQIADRTGGRVLSGFNDARRLFDREGLSPVTSSQPIEDVLIPVLIGIMLMDVAVRRVAWDWVHVKQLASSGVRQVHAFLSLGCAPSAAAVGALRRVKSQARETQRRMFEPVVVSGGHGHSQPWIIENPAPRPEAGAAKQEVSGSRGELVGSLLDAKRRAQDVIRQKEIGG